MSVYYSVYAEANVDGHWYNLCPFFKNRENGLPLLGPIRFPGNP